MKNLAHNKRGKRVLPPLTKPSPVKFFFVNYNALLFPSVSCVAEIAFIGRFFPLVVASANNI
jgi:hypothetical protein